MKKAAALILVLVVMIIVGLGTAAIMQAMISYAQMKVISINKIKAQYLAEAALQFAIYQCRQGNFSSPPNPSFPASDIPEEWKIYIQKNDPQQNGSYEITATVQYPGI